jgi:hypothetical protein
MTASHRSRRRFLQQAELLVTAPLILPRRVWAQESASSKRITFGCIGMGKQMLRLLGVLINRDVIEVSAVCDVKIGARSASARYLMNFGFHDDPNFTWNPARTRFASSGVSSGSPAIAGASSQIHS